MIMRIGLAAFLCVLMLGLPACGLRQNYLYRPSPLEKALERATTTAEDGKVTVGKIILSDLDVMLWIEAIEQAWRKRDQVAKGLEVGESAAESSLGFVSVLLSYLELAPGIGPIITGIGIVGKMVMSAINPKGRTEAYADGMQITGAAKAKYHAVNSKQGEGAISAERLTEAGAALQASGYCAISVVDANLAGRQTGPC